MRISCDKNEYIIRMIIYYQILFVCIIAKLKLGLVIIIIRLSDKNAFSFAFFLDI